MISQCFSAYQEIFCQSQLDYDRFVSLGCEESRLRLVGSTKYDLVAAEPSDEEKDKLLSSLGLRVGAPLFIAASVRRGEFEQVIDAYSELLGQGRDLQFLVAPRHPEYFEEVANYLSVKGIGFSRYSELSNREANSKVVLLDAMGVLSQLYVLADFCFVGGSLVPIGGHNPLEPAAAGTPVLSGPHMGNVAELFSQMREAAVIEVVADAEELTEGIGRFLDDSTFLEQRRVKTKDFVEKQRGASSQIVDKLLAVLCLETVEQRQSLQL